METIVRQTREVGTSAGVLLPKKWLNKQVVVTLFAPSRGDILKEVIDILAKNNLNEEVKGIYLYGSYARGDYDSDSDSDIDVLVLTEKTNKLINHNAYEIQLISEDNLSKNITTNLQYQSIIKESIALLNKSLLEKYSKVQAKPNIKKNLNEISKILKINKETLRVCEENNKKIPDGIIYSLILRLRELYIIKCLLSNKSYNKNQLVKLCGEKSYAAYVRVKTNQKEINDVPLEDARKLIDLSEKWLNELKG